MPSFFPETPRSRTTSKNSKDLRYSDELLHKNECAVCPLNNNPETITPHMEPTGAEDPIVYILGEAPGQEEDETGEQFVGRSGQVLRNRIPRKWIKKIRFNNCVRTRPVKNKTPQRMELECCRPSIVRDIEKTKPKAIFGFGNVPLSWVTRRSGISVWSGRCMPVRIGDHVCWFFPMYHPAFILRQRRWEPKSKEDYPSEEEFAFALHLQKAFDLVERLPQAKVHSSKQVFNDIDIRAGGSDDIEEVVEFLEKASRLKVVGLDYETNAIRPYKKGSKILTIAVATKYEVMAFAVDHPQAKWSPHQRRRLDEAFKRFLLKGRSVKAVHNLAFELEWSAYFFGKEVVHGGNWACTMAQAYILDERQGAGVQSLDGLCFQYFGFDLKALSPVDRANLENTEIDRVLWYNAPDAKYHRLLYLKQIVRLKDDHLMNEYEHNVDRIKSLVLTQLKGVPVDFETVDRFYDEYSAKIEKIDAKLVKLRSVNKFKNVFDHEFRPSSNHDVKKMVTHILKKQVKTVNEAELKEIDVPLTRLVLARRHAAKVLSTYVNPVRRGSEILFGGNTMHPQFPTTVTRTWRTASDSPNIQNWPKRQNVEIRSQVRPRPGYKIVAFDYSGIQARNVAMESRDPTLVQAFEEHYDMHTDWMENILRSYPKWIDGGKAAAKDKEVFKKYRHRAKNQFVFPKFFGAQPKSIARNLGIPERIAEGLSEEFYDRYPGVLKWHKWLRQFYREYGYVTGLSGFRRRAPVKQTEIINTPIQSDESVIVLDALIRLSELGLDQYQASLEVHDDLTFIWPADKVDEYAETVITMMLDTSYEWAKIVPLGVEMSIGDDWGHLEGVGEWFTNTWEGSING